MRQTIGRHSAFVTGVSPVQVSIGVPLYLNDRITLNADKQTAAALVHSGAMRLYPPHILRHGQISLII
ncbi:MAG: hypothetical protein CSYNP_04470 [Syntrophus sp. SKADARSKE-3]|nr:hypothetical protein [Syntrophus sp. SKADARSKE-3]